MHSFHEFCALLCRMLTENDEVRIYHTLENARVYHGNTPQYVEIMPKVNHLSIDNCQNHFMPFQEAILLSEAKI